MFFFFFSPAAIPWQGVGGVGVGDNWRRLGSGEAPPHGGGGTQAVSPRVSPPKPSEVSAVRTQCHLPAAPRSGGKETGAGGWE